MIGGSVHETDCSTARGALASGGAAEVAAAEARAAAGSGAAAEGDNAVTFVTAVPR